MILHVVLYRPSAEDAKSGEIWGAYSASKARIRQLKHAWVPVRRHRPDYHLTHRVTAGRLAPKTADERAAAATAAAWADLRRQRDARLAQTVDTISPPRWTALTPAAQAAWTTYRQALLDLPANTTDPTAPVWPLEPGGF
jgi:hypothetical protein